MIQGSRKLGCPAHIIVKVYEIFPEYEISETEVSCSSKKALKMLKEQKMKQLKTSLTNQEPVLTKKKNTLFLFHLKSLMRRATQLEPLLE